MLDDSTFNILWDSRVIDQKISELALNLIKRWEKESTVNLVPVLTGGLIFSSKLITELEMRSPDKWVITPVLASAYGDHYDAKEPEIVTTKDFKSKFVQSAPCVILDDLLDTGVTLTRLKEFLRNFTKRDIEIAVLVDKRARRQGRLFQETVELEADYFCFRIEENRWLVGFGMDNKGRMRGLNSIGYLT